MNRDFQPASLETRLHESQKFLSFALQTFAEKESSPLLSSLQERCSRCLLGERAVSIKNGLCEVCRGFDERHQHERSSDSKEANQHELRELHSILLEACGAGACGYDALLMYSGGKDSAYLLDELQRRYPKLRLLALMIDSGFASEIAFQNIEYTFRKVEASHSIVTPYPSLFHKLFRHCLVHFEQKGGYETIDRADGDLLFDVGKNFAARMQIPLIIAGLSRAQCEDILKLDSFEIPSAQIASKRESIASFSLPDIYGIVDYRYWWDGTDPPAGFRPRVIFPYFSWEYDEDQVRKVVSARKLLPESQVDPIVTNHRLIPVILALDYLRLGYCTFEPEFSKLIREGRAQRRAWLPVFQAIEYLAPRGEFMPNSIASALAQLNLNAEDLEMPLMTDSEVAANYTR